MASSSRFSLAARPGVPGLPTELLNEICSHLCRHCQGGHATVVAQFEYEPDEAGIETSELSESGARKGQTALLNLARTCRSLYAAAQPFLYHYFATTTPFNLHLFVRTLEERPDLGSRVSEVNICLDSRFPDGQSPFDSGQSESSAMRHESFFECIDSDAWHRMETEDDSEDGVEGREDAELISQLLPLVSNLERAHLGLHLPTEGYDREAMFPSLNQWTCSPLTSLKRLAFSGIGDEFTIDYAAPILRLAPNLEVLHCHGKVYCWMPSDLNNSLPNLLELNLTGDSLCYSDVRALLTVVGPRLSKFTAWRTSKDNMGNMAMMHLSDFLGYLRPWAGTLRELSVALYDLQAPLDESAIKALRRLRKGFRALEILRAQTISFDLNGRLKRPKKAFTSALPSSLRELRLMGKGSRETYYPASHLLSALRGLLGAFLAGQFPALSRIDIDKRCPPNGYEELEEIAVGFRTAGVKFQIYSFFLREDCMLM